MGGKGTIKRKLSLSMGLYIKYHIKRSRDCFKKIYFQLCVCVCVGGYGYVNVGGSFSRGVMSLELEIW